MRVQVLTAVTVIAALVAVRYAGRKARERITARGERQREQIRAGRGLQRVAADTPVSE